MQQTGVLRSSFYFHLQYQNVRPCLPNFLPEAKLGSTIVSDALMVSEFGWKNCRKNSVNKLVLIVENFTEVVRVNLCSIFKAFVMLDDNLHIFPYNILLLHLIIYHLRHHLYMAISRMKIPVYQVVIVYMVIMPMSMTHTWQFHIPVLRLDQKMPTITFILR